MPFILPVYEEKQTHFMTFRSISSTINLNKVVLKIAGKFVKDRKKVLLFDTLLGIKNFPIFNKKENIIQSFFEGQLALPNLVITHNGIDIISGPAKTDLNALSIFEQNKIKTDLLTLSKHYDEVMILLPHESQTSLFSDIQSTYWITSNDKKILLKTLSATSNSNNNHIILDQEYMEDEMKKINLTCKTLDSKCHLMSF